MVRQGCKAGSRRSAFCVRMIISMVCLTGTVESGCTFPLLQSSAIEDTNIVRGLIEAGQDVNKALPIVGTTPLILAASQGQEEVVQLLIDAGVDVNTSDFTGWTALHAAAFKGSPKVVLLLLEHGAVSSGGGWFLPKPEEVAETLGHRDLIPLLRGAHTPAQVPIPSSPAPSIEQGEAQNLPTAQDVTEEQSTVHKDNR